MTNKQIENFINAMMNRDPEEDELFPNGDREDHEEDVMENIYHEMGK